jgi:hypothetical protein
MDERQKLAERLNDPDLVKYFYLDLDTAGLIDRLNSLRLEICESQDDVPFNAQVKGYLASHDESGHPWIVKAVSGDDEMLYHRSCMVAYVLDHATGTFAAPTAAVSIGKKKYRVTKVVRHSVQISSYNYLEEPFIDILRADLVNRWIYFDEDRNPNNYLVITNGRNEPFVVSIDYDKADILSDAMKITGVAEKFGWLRTEKTRFLTLLRPENFDGVSICTFDDRLRAFGSIDRRAFRDSMIRVFDGYCDDAAAMADRVSRNVFQRYEYVNDYFRKMFKSEADTKGICNDADYSAFGQSFLDMHSKKK